MPEIAEEGTDRTSVGAVVLSSGRIGPLLRAHAVQDRCCLRECQACVLRSEDV